MNSDIIARIFGVLQNLEKCLDGIHTQLNEKKHRAPEIAALLPQHQRVVKQMRSVANKLQLQFAREDWEEVVRSLKIFYGLNHLVRTDILIAYGRLNSNQVTTQVAETAVEKAGIFH